MMKGNEKTKLAEEQWVQSRNGVMDARRGNQHSKEHPKKEYAKRVTP
jgi:hypothetical protein